MRRRASGRWLVERYESRGEVARRLESLDLPEGEAVRRIMPERLYLESVPPRPRRGGRRRGPGDGRLGPRAVSLHPLVGYDADAGEALLLNARRGRKRLEYLSYSTGREVERADLEDEQHALLARVLRTPVDAAQGAEWAARSQAEEQAQGPTEEAPAAPRQATTGRRLLHPTTPAGRAGGGRLGRSETRKPLVSRGFLLSGYFTKAVLCR